MALFIIIEQDKPADYYPLTAEPPGSTLPSRYSRSAPPAVDIYDMPEAISNLLPQATESPPPTNEKAPFLVASPIA